jgi:hypothetical protein
VDGLLQGWALRVDERAGTRQDGVRLLVSVEGEPVAELLADQHRADVAEALKSDAACGFAYAPPPELRARGAGCVQGSCAAGDGGIAGEPG